jgi:hypothetical protein
MRDILFVRMRPLFEMTQLSPAETESRHVRPRERAEY